MPREDERLRRCLEHATFQRQYLDIDARNPRARAFVEGARYVLMRDARAGHRIPEWPEIWFLASTVGALTLYYVFDEARVHFAWLDEAQPLSSAE